MTFLKGKSAGGMGPRCYIPSVLHIWERFYGPLPHCVYVKKIPWRGSDQRTLMRFVTRVKELSFGELKAIASGSMRGTVSDADFLETLAGHRCILVPPWIMRAQPDGGLARVTKLIYDHDGNIDKVHVLLAVAREFRRAQRHNGGFGGRFVS